jgi:hypothetical protein
MRILMIALVLSMILPAEGSAGDWDGCESELSASCALRISVCPRGDFESIAKGCGGSGDYIEVIIRDASGNGIPGIPWTDYWMNSCDPAYMLHLCVGAFVADSLTGPNGRTTFSGQISAGGCIPSGGIWVSCQGRTILNPECTMPICLDVVIVSPDLNVDGVINLSDLTFFGLSYNRQAGEAEYNTCCDFNDDDWCDLSDFSFLGEHYEHTCF